MTLGCAASLGSGRSGPGGVTASPQERCGPLDCLRYQSRPVCGRRQCRGASIVWIAENRAIGLAKGHFHNRGEEGRTQIAWHQKMSLGRSRVSWSKNPRNHAAENGAASVSRYRARGPHSAKMGNRQHQHNLDPDSYRTARRASVETQHNIPTTSTFFAHTAATAWLNASHSRPGRCRKAERGKLARRGYEPLGTDRF